MDSTMVKNFVFFPLFNLLLVLDNIYFNVLVGLPHNNIQNEDFIVNHIVGQPVNFMNIHIKANIRE